MCEVNSDEQRQEADQWLERTLALPARERKAFLDGCADEDVRDHVLKLVELAQRSDGLSSPDVATEAAADLTSGFRIGQRLLDRYELADKVGQGAMGAVFRARDSKLDRDVAVKVVSGANIDDHAREQLLGEARAAAALNHPNVVAIHDVGEERGQPFFVMELVEGETLETAPPRGITQVVAIARQLCAALEHAHARGIVHRDLKPSNVLLVHPQGGRHLKDVKLVDLGMALARDCSQVTREGYVLGTPAYMAPEQALGTEVDGRADLYALGVMTYQWVTGELPFRGDDVLAVISQHIHAAVVPPRSSVPDLPSELDVIIMRLLAKDPSERFASAADLDEALSSLSTTDDASDAPRLRATTTALADGEATMRINRRLTGASELSPMYGREHPLQIVADVLRRLTDFREGSVLLIEGEPGTGKSRLVAEMAARATDTGALVLAGVASVLSNRLPYAPFVEAWTEHLQASGQTAEDNPFSSFEPAPDQLQENTLRLFQTVESAIFRNSQGGPAVIIVEDLHWADDSSLRLLHELHMRAATRPLLLVGSYRASEVPSQGTLHSMLINLKRQQLVKRIRLEPLSADETRVQINALSGAGDTDADFAKRVFEISGGNPLFTEEIVVDAIERGDPTGSVEIPESLAGLMQDRVARLGDAAQELLRMASVAGPSFRFEWVRAARELAGAEAASMLDALEASLNSGLLEEEDDKYRFRHALVREAVYGSLSRERKKVFHGAIANAIRDIEPEDDGSRRDGLLAHHYQAAGRPLDAVPHLLDAGRFAMWRTGFEEARMQFEAALEILDLHGETSGPRQFRLKSGLGSANLAVANLDAALDCFEAAAALPPNEDGWKLEPEERARALRWAAVTRINSGDLRRADELLSEAMSSLSDGSPELPSVLYHIAQLRWSEGNHQEAYKIAERTVTEAEAVDDPKAVAKGYEMLALACHSMGEWREGVEFVEKRKEIVGDAVDVADAFDAHL
jgi:tetratricopeptide (TPR) repeat protein